MKKVAINWFWRIWRLTLRSYFENNFNNDFEIVAVNDPSSNEILTHLFEFDSSFWRFKWNVSFDHWNLIINWKKIKSFSEREPEKLPWKDLWIDIVLECTWVFKSKEWCQRHIDSWAKWVIISAPWKWCIDWTYVYWVNHKDFKWWKDFIISNASCTTNCLAPVVKVLNDEFWITKWLMNTIHSYTWDQKLLDASHKKDLRRSRSAAESICPTKTWAAVAVALVIPEMKWKLDGFALRIPTPVVSCVDFTFETKKEISVEKINNLLKKSSENEMKNIIEFEERPLVSIDHKWSLFSAIIDKDLTKVVWWNLWKIVAWYDNEYWYSTRLLDMCKYSLEKI